MTIKRLVILNCLSVGEDKSIYTLADTQSDLYYIYLNGCKFATFYHERDAIITSDMLHLHFEQYQHLYENCKPQRVCSVVDIEDMSAEALKSLKHQYYQETHAERTKDKPLADAEELISTEDLHNYYAHVIFVDTEREA